MLHQSLCSATGIPHSTHTRTRAFGSDFFENSFCRKVMPSKTEEGGARFAEFSTKRQIPGKKLHVQDIRALAGPLEPAHQPALHHVERPGGQVPRTDRSLDLAILLGLADVDRDVAGPAVHFLAPLDAADLEVARAQVDGDVAPLRHVDGEVHAVFHARRGNHRAGAADIGLPLDPGRIFRVIHAPRHADLRLGPAGDLVVPGGELHRDGPSRRERLVDGHATGGLECPRGGHQEDRGGHGQCRSLHGRRIRDRGDRSSRQAAIASTWRRTLPRSVRSCARRASVSRSLSPSARTKRLYGAMLSRIRAVLRPISPSNCVRSACDRRSRTSAILARISALACLRLAGMMKNPSAAITLASRMPVMSAAAVLAAAAISVPSPTAPAPAAAAAATALRAPSASSLASRRRSYVSTTFCAAPPTESTRRR